MLVILIYFGCYAVSNLTLQRGKASSAWGACSFSDTEVLKSLI